MLCWIFWPSWAIGKVVSCLLGLVGFLQQYVLFFCFSSGSLLYTSSALLGTFSFFFYQYNCFLSIKKYYIIDFKRVILSTRLISNQNLMVMPLFIPLCGRIVFIGNGQEMFA